MEMGHLLLYSMQKAKGFVRVNFYSLPQRLLKFPDEKFCYGIKMVLRTLSNALGSEWLLFTLSNAMGSWWYYILWVML